MAKGDKMKSQTQPPIGIKYKAWARKNPSRSAPHHSGLSSFTVACPNRSCEKHGHNLGAILMADKAIHAGVKPPTECPNCGTPIPRSGYIGGEIADAE